MENREWVKSIERIRDLVQDAVSTQNYTDLNNEIKSVINQTTNQVGNEINKVTKDIRNNFKDSFQEVTQNKEKPNQTVRKQVQIKRECLTKSPKVAYGGGMALFVCGIVFTSVLGIAEFILGIIAIATGGLHSPVLIPIGILLPFLCGSVFMLNMGNTIKNRIVRFQDYLRCFKGKEYSNIKDIACYVGKSERFVRKDIKNMVKRRFFLEGHFDSGETCFMISDAIYEQYLEMENQKPQIKKEKQIKELKEANKPKEKEPSYSTEVEALLCMGKEYVTKIKRSCEQIPVEAVTQKLNRMELIISKILAQVERQPEIADELGRFMNYYLPTTWKLISTYEEMTRQSIQGENIVQACREIENTLDTINEAFEKLLDSFFEEKALDISTDISVLHTMFAQEGLTKGDFEG